MSRGIAFPTCLSKNELAGHFAPIDAYNEEQPQGPGYMLEDGDLVKIDLGVQFDGFAALAATTFQVGGGKIDNEKKSRVMSAAWTAAECAIRMMKPGTPNEDITDILTAVAEEYECSCLEGVLSHELRQYVIDGENTILSKPKPEQQVESFKLEPNKVYAMDLVMSSGQGKGIRKEIYDTTIYKRVVDTIYSLRNKTSRELLKTVNRDHPTYPFSLRNFAENQKSLTRARAGLKECVNHELLADYPVLHEKDGEFIAQFKFTVVVRPNQGPLRLCGTKTVDTAQLIPHEIKNEKLTELLATTWENPKRKKRKKKKKKKAQQADAE